MKSISFATALDKAALLNWQKALQGILRKLDPIRAYLDVEALEKELAAFSHTASLIMFTAEALWNNNQAKPSKTNLFDAPCEVLPF